MNGTIAPGDVQLLMQALYEAMPAILTWATAVTLHTIRFVIVLTILPLTAQGVLNDASRMGIAALLALFMALGRPPDEYAALQGAEVLMLVVKEVFIGVALGFAMSTVFWVIEFVGAMIDNAAGFNSVQQENPMRGDQSTPVSDLLSRLAGAIFFAIGGAVYFTQAMFDSFVVWPAFDLYPSAQGAYNVFIERQVGTLFSSVLKLVAPLLIIVVLIDVGMGLLSRSAERLEPAALAQPIKGVAAVLVVVLMVSTMFDQLRHHLLPRDVVRQLDPAAPGR